MGLSELNEKLHSRDLHMDRVRKPSLFEPQGVEADPADVSEFHQTEAWKDPSTSPAEIASQKLSRKYRRTFALTLGGLALIALLIGVAVKLRLLYFSEANVAVTLTGTVAAASAEQATFVFRYTNNNWASLKNAAVVFEYPETFAPDPAASLLLSEGRAEAVLGEVPSRGTGEVRLSGKFYVTRDDQAVVKAALVYDAANGKSRIGRPAEGEVRLASLPLSFEVAAPLELASDQEVQYEIRYGNTGTASFKNLEIRLEYPRGFTFIGAEPGPSSGDALWSLGELKAESEGKIVVRGKLVGERDEQKLVHGGIGFVRGDGRFIAYKEHERRTRIAASPFIILQKVNGSTGPLLINPGEKLSYEISYKNDGSIGIRDAILTAEIDSPYIDWSTLQLNSKGAYVESTKAIFWKASDVPALARIDPSESGTISFAVSTYADLKERFPDAREISIRSIAKIDSPDIPALNGSTTKVVASRVLTAKLNAPLITDFSGYYQDTVFPNSGPISPIVGQETTYTFHYQATGFLNRIENARISFMLPTGIRYTSKMSPSTEKMTFNERSNELVWDIGTLEPGKGRELVFQIGATPYPGSVGQEVILVSKASFTGRDVFTGQELKLEKERKTSNLSEDASTQNGYKVRAAE